MAGDLLRILSGQMAHQWRGTVILEDPWIYPYTEHETIWASAGEMASGRERQTIQSAKLMLTVVRNPSGFHVMKSLPKRIKFSAPYYVNNIVMGISDW
jgi:hypothetical protein